MLRYNNQALFGAFLLFLISCTIVKDSDITSLAQLNALSLKSFEIVQNSKAGNSTALAVLKYDSVVNKISKSTGAHVSRVKGFTLPALGNYKMKLKSGTNAATIITIEYKDNGMANSFVIYQGDSIIENYKFFYNSTNQFVKFVGDINPIDNKPKTLQIIDSVILPAGNVYPSSVIRKSSDATLTGTFTMEVNCQNCGGSTIDPIIFKQSNQTVYQINFYTGGSCNNDYYIYSCGGVGKSNGTGGSGQNNNQTQVSFLNNFTFNKTLQTSLTSISNTDTYYFHPIMILKDVVPNGDFYYWFYTVDWFQTTGVSSNNSDMVKINFNYGK